MHTLPMDTNTSIEVLHTLIQRVKTRLCMIIFQEACPSAVTLLHSSELVHCSASGQHHFHSWH